MGAGQIETGSGCLSTLIEDKKAWLFSETDKLVVFSAKPAAEGLKFQHARELLGRIKIHLEFN